MEKLGHDADVLTVQLEVVALPESEPFVQERTSAAQLPPGGAVVAA